MGTIPREVDDMSKETGYGLYAIPRSKIYFGWNGETEAIKNTPVINVVLHDGYVGEWLTRALEATPEHRKLCPVWVVGRAVAGDYRGILEDAPHMGRVGIAPEDFKYATRLM
jgi:hypothetical protein